MAAVTVAPGRSLPGKIIAGLAARQRKARGKPGRLAVLAARAREHVVTVAALTAVDLGGWHYGPGAGWFVTAASLLALDFAVRG